MFSKNTHFITPLKSENPFYLKGITNYFLTTNDTKASSPFISDPNELEK
jgi:hypothetical protein